MYYILLDNISSIQKGFMITSRPSMPAPEKNYNTYDIPGRDGTLYEDLGTIDDIEIEVECNYIASEHLWNEKWREIKKWLFERHKLLQFSDDHSCCYRIKTIALSANERTIKIDGSFSITFVLEGYTYFINGLEKQPYEYVKYNPYESTKPLYYITGNGTCILTVNGTECTCAVSDNLIIDTYLQLSYKEDGTNQNTSVNCNYEGLKLLQGDNEISITSGFDLEIVPNWRCY